MNAMPDGKNLDRAEWEKGATVGWGIEIVGGDPVPPQKLASFTKGVDYGQFWRRAKDAARARGEMVAGPTYPQPINMNPA